jgi:hypothetical protein
VAEASQIGREDITSDDFNLWLSQELVPEQTGQIQVQFKGYHMADPLGQQVSHGPSTRPDLENEIIRPKIERFDDAPAVPFVAKEVLAEFGAMGLSHGG